MKDLDQRYDDFQREAVDAVVADFRRKQIGRFLLVIPTGGGKTRTAVKSVCKLFNENVLHSGVDKVLWTAHRAELLDQAKRSFSKVLNATGYQIDKEDYKTAMISRVGDELESDPSIRLVVVDEAHHGAAASYQVIFKTKRIGVLGLTATPSRHDGRPLEFEKESYSIGFPDLIKKGIILKPSVINVIGERYDIAGFSDGDLENLNNEFRNHKLIASIQDNKEKFTKVIIYVGTKKHAHDLYVDLQKNLKNDYESISYITGADNSRQQDRKDFIAKEKTFSRSILVNVQVLSEGYDDPKVNTVIMAAPSKSKLYYMQALGRAIRYDPKNDLKKAYVVELVDELPNIRYRIDNRWLYSDISDSLEPAVIDVDYGNAEEFKKSLEMVYEGYNVKKEFRKYPELDPSMRYTMLLFKQYGGPGEYYHYSILLNNCNRPILRNMFNFLSMQMSKFCSNNYPCDKVFDMIASNNGIDIVNSTEKRFVYDAMTNAYKVIQAKSGTNDDRTKAYPWITFVSFNFRSLEKELPESLYEFINDMVNREEILERLLMNNYKIGEFLLRLPLPLSGSIGIISTKRSYEEIKDVIDCLNKIKASGLIDHRPKVRELLENSVLPIEINYRDSLTVICRESQDYHYML